MAIPLFNTEASQVVDIASSSTISNGIAISPGAAANTKSAWTQLIASTANDIGLLVIGLALFQASNADAMSIDIGIGAAGSEIALLSDLMFGWGNENAYISMDIPLTIPKGTRISYRYQSSSTNASNVISLNIQGYSLNGHVVSGYDTIGFNAAQTKGVAITPSATANTKGSYAQIIASTSREYKGLMAAFDEVGSLNGVSYMFDIAVGGAGAELNVVANFMAPCCGNGPGLAFMPMVPLKIPSGSRLSARCSANGAGKSAYDITLYGAF